MIRILNGNKMPPEQIMNRTIADYGEYEVAVRTIINEVRSFGDAALFEYAERFDKVKLASLEVCPEEIEEAVKAVGSEFSDVLLEAAENISFYHKQQLKSGFTIDKGNILLGQRVLPIERAGIYVPGGTAAYPSTVLMNAIPAKIAGVGQIIMATPPDKSGKIRPEILVAAKLAGVDRIFKIGGAGAIAALAYGTESVPRVDKITGPGNIYVALAKKEVFGKVGIDMVAGPSEILVVADKNADSAVVATDMLSQAEHDRLACAALVTDSAALAQAVAEEIEKQLADLPREEIARASINDNGKIIVVDDLVKAIEFANVIAPEHLELFIDDAEMWLDKIKNAGSIFIGRHTPEALGDYFAGVNHTLPTGGSARFSSPLSVDDFLKKTSFIRYSESALNECAAKVALFARKEGLDAHAKSVEARFKKE